MYLLKLKKCSNALTSVQFERLIQPLHYESHIKHSTQGKL